MAKNFLDEGGLSYFWEKIKALLNGKQDKGDYVTPAEIPQEVEVKDTTGVFPTDNDVKIYAEFTDDPGDFLDFVPEVPDDGKTYVRKYGEWCQAQSGNIREVVGETDEINIEL